MNPGVAVNNITNTSGFWHAYVGKLDAGGNYIFANHINGKSNAYDIALDKLGRIYVVGEFTQTVDFNPTATTNSLTASGGASGSSGFLVRYDNAGTYNWAYRNGGTTTLASFQGLDLDSNGNMYIVGFANNTIDLDFSTAQSNFTSSFGGGFLVKCDSNLAYQWAHMISGTVQFNPAFEVKVAGDKVCMTGHFNGTNVDFDGTANTQYLSSVKRAAYLAAYNLDGTYVYAQKINDVTSVGNNLDQRNGNIYWIGTFSDSAAVSLNATGASSLSNGSNDVFVGAYAIGNSALSINYKPQLICDNSQLYLQVNSLSAYESIAIYGLKNNAMAPIAYMPTSSEHKLQLSKQDFEEFIVELKDMNNQKTSYRLYNSCNNKMLEYIINNSTVGIQWNGDAKPTKVRIYNLQGQEVHRSVDGNTAINCGIVPGIYLLEVSTNAMRKIVRFVVE
jgi:ribosomal protein S11